MIKESLGMLEVKGLVAAITVGDTMAKAANVHVRQKTLAKGHGWTTILVTGDVGAVNAALSAGKSIAVEKGWMVSAKVIARPAATLELALEPDVNESKAPAVPEKNTGNKIEEKAGLITEAKTPADLLPTAKEEVKETVEDIKEDSKAEAKANEKSTAAKSSKGGNSKAKKSGPKNKK